MRKKMTAGLLSGILLVASCCGLEQIYAWLTSADEQHNYMTVGENDVEIVEEFPDPDPQPGKELKKQVAFLNTGSVPCYVRARYFFSDSQAEEETEVKFGSEKWKKEEDGYHYYEQIVMPGETTENYLMAVLIKGKIEKEFDLTVYTETVQAEGFDTAKEAFEHLLAEREAQYE